MERITGKKRIIKITAGSVGPRNEVSRRTAQRKLVSLTSFSGDRVANIGSRIIARSSGNCRALVICESAELELEAASIICEEGIIAGTLTGREGIRATVSKAASSRRRNSQLPPQLSRVSNVAGHGPVVREMKTDKTLSDKGEAQDAGGWFPTLKNAPFAERRKPRGYTKNVHN